MITTNDAKYDAGSCAQRERRKDNQRHSQLCKPRTGIPKFRLAQDYANSAILMRNYTPLAAMQVASSHYEEASKYGTRSVAPREQRKEKCWRP
jgi:hypothetical protein